MVFLILLISLPIYLDLALGPFGTSFYSGTTVTVLETFSSQTSLYNHFLHIKQKELLHALEAVRLTLHSDEICLLLQSDKFLGCSSNSSILFLKLLLDAGETLLFLVLL